MSAEHRKWDIFSTQEVSKQLVFYDVMFYFWYKHKWNSKPLHINTCFAAKGAIYYVTIAMAVTISLLLIIPYRTVIINTFCNTVQLIAWKLVITRTEQT